MLQEVHAPIVAGKIDRISSQRDYSFVSIGIALLAIGLVLAIAILAYPGESGPPLDPSSLPMG
jgi:hypothetical protein